MNIVIIEQNKIYRESLKTVLDQVSDFNVVYDSDNTASLEDLRDSHVHFMLIDYNLGIVKCSETMNKAISLWPDVRFLLLTTYKEEHIFQSNKMSRIILKNATKKEFECQIKSQAV